VMNTYKKMQKLGKESSRLEGFYFCETNTIW